MAALNPVVRRKYPDEMAAAGRLLVDYGELEINLMNCVKVARDDLDATLKTMFRVRSEKQRIDIADALGRTAYRRMGLTGDFERAIGAMHYCRSIRNQYAHAYWHDYGGLCLVALEDLAQKNEFISDLSGLNFHYVNIDLLENQHTYFRYTADLLLYANYQGRLLSGEISATPFPERPQEFQRPPLRVDPPA